MADRTEHKPEQKAGQEFCMLAPGHSGCAGCGVAIAVNLISQAAPRDVIVSCATSCLEIISSAYPHTAWNVPWIHAAFETASSVASGIEAAVERLGKPWKVLAIAGDGGTFDIGIQALSGMLERGHKVTQVCVDNEAYMNCLSTDSLIMTENGLKKITDIKKGEKIYAFSMKNHDLVLKKCKGVFDNGKKTVFDIETLHHNIKATGNHPFLVLKHNGRGRKHSFIWKTIEELKKNDEIVVLKNLRKGKPYEFPKIKQSKKGDYKVNKINQAIIPKKSNKDLMEFLGLYVGDGWVRSEKRRAETGFSIPENNRARKRLIKLIDKIFKAKTSTNKNEVHIQSVNVAKFIDSLGFGYGSKNKTIPSWIFTLTEEEKKAFLKGLMLSDGYRVDNSFRYTSSSYELLKRLRLLLQTMDYRTGKIHWRKTKKGTIIVYRALLKDTESGYVCFSTKRKWNVEKYPSQYKYQNFLVKNKYFDIEKVKKITKIGVEKTLDLRVEDEHNFIADGIVVHNTGVQRSAATPEFAWTTTTPAGKASAGKRGPKKPIAEIVAAHRIPYVASASIAYPADLIKKMKRAFEKQPSFVHILCPCPPGWKSDISKTVEIGRLAVETGTWALFEIEDGAFRITKRFEHRKPVEEYLKTQGRFKHLKDRHIEEIQKQVDTMWDEYDRREKSQ